MPHDRKFYFFMAIVGILAGLLLARSPEARDFAVRPVFWMLIAVELWHRTFADERPGRRD